MADGGSSPAQQRERDNQTLVKVAKLHFVARESYRLKLEPFGEDDKYEDGVDLGLRTLSAEELRPTVARDLADALAAADSGTQVQRDKARRKAIEDYAAVHALRSRWVYAFSVHDGKRTFAYELRIDAKGRVRRLKAEDFANIRADDDGLDDDRDEDYLARPEWKGGEATHLEHVVPTEAQREKIRWLFFGSPLRLAQSRVEELRKDDGLWAPETGIDLLGKSVLSVGDKELVGPLGLGTRFGVLVEVFDPMQLVTNLVAEYQRRRDRNLEYLTPHAELSPQDRSRVEHRTFCRAIANSVRMLLRSSSTEPGAMQSALAGATRWATMRAELFTAAERERLDALKLPGQTNKAWEQFLDEDRALQELNVREMAASGTVLMLLLTSKPWGLMERAALGSKSRERRDGYRFVRLCCEALACLGDVNTGGRFVSELVDHIEEEVADVGQPGLTTIRAYVLRNPTAPELGDHAKTAFKAGTAPLTLWSKLVSFYNAKNSAFLERMFERSGVDVTDAALVKLVGALPKQQRILATSCLTMQLNLSRVYKTDVFSTTLDVFGGGSDPVAVFHTDGGDGLPLGKAVNFRLAVTDDFADRVDALREETLHEPFEPPPEGAKLTFDNVANFTGLISLAFSVRSLALAIEQEAPSDKVAKSAFDVFKTVYGIPWVQKKIGGKASAFITKGFAEKWAKRLIGKGPGAIAAVIQAVSWGFAVHDFSKKQAKSSNEALTISALSLVSESLLLLASGAVLFGSGFTLAPLAALLVLLAAVVSTAQFVYMQQIGADDEKLARLCLFGASFHQGTTVAHKEARAWMTCPGHDARFFNPKFTAQHPQLRNPYEAYGRQLGAFTNFLSSFDVQLEFGARLDGHTGLLKITPGLLPRAAYFQIRLEVTWVSGEVTNVTHFDDDDLWAKTFEFRFYPDAATALPLPVAGRPSQALVDLRKEGIMGVAGGPLAINTADFPASIEVDYRPAAGLPTRLEGTLSGGFDDGKPGMHAPRKVRARYRVSVKNGVQAGRQICTITIDLSNDTADDLVPVRLDGTLDVTSVVDGGTEQVQIPLEDLKPQLHDAADRKYRLEVDIGDTSAQRFGQLSAIDLQFRDGLGQTGIGIGPQSMPVDGVFVAVFRYVTQERYRYEIPYEAVLAHDGGQFVVTLAHGLATLTALDDPSRSISNADLELASVGFLYVRNPGQPEPVGQGSKEPGKRLSVSLLPKSGHERTFVGTRAADPFPDVAGAADPSIRIEDRLSCRFTVGMQAPGKVQFHHSIEPWIDDVHVRWSWADPSEAGQAGTATLLQRTRVAIHLVLEGDETQPKFMPSATPDSGPAQPTDLELELDVDRVRMNVACDDYLVDPSSESVAALTKCSC